MLGLDDFACPETFIGPFINLVEKLIDHWKRIFLHQQTKTMPGKKYSSTYPFCLVLSSVPYLLRSVLQYKAFYIDSALM